jgi:hypothetical protein
MITFEKTCPFCRKTIDGFATRCPYCTSIQPDPPPRTENAAPVWGIVGGLIVGFATGSFWFGLLFAIIITAVMA